MSIKSKTFYKLRHLESLPKNRIRNTAILSKAEAIVLQQNAISKGVSYIHNLHTKVMFFTTTHGYVDLPPGFTAATDCGKTVESLVEMFPRTEVLETVQELVTHLDKYYPWYGHVKDSEQPKWLPEHFPEGTVVELANFYLDNNDERRVGSPMNRSERKPAIFTVDSIVKTGIDNHVIVTTSFNPRLGGMFDSFNFNHVYRIIKRGEGKVNVKTYGGAWYEKANITRGLLKKSHYYWTDTWHLFSHIVDLMPSYRNMRFNDTFIRQLNSQTFVKKCLIDGFYEVLHADKKKLKEYVRKNANRWLLTAKEAQRIQRENDEESSRQYYEDMEYMQERNHVEQEEVITRGINQYGNNQEYIDGEPVCGNCKCCYVNSGGDAPLGMGMHCMNCQNEDPVDYHDGDGCFPVTSIGMPSDEQIQSDVAYLANKGNASGY